MARQTIIVYVDDVTGQEADTVQTVTLTHEGVAYEVDMSPETLAEYEKVIEPYRLAGRRVGRVTTAGHVMRVVTGSAPIRRRVPSIDPEQRKAIRSWWARNAKVIPTLPPLVERGRIPQSVVDAYNHREGRNATPMPALTAQAVSEAVSDPVAADVQPAGTERAAGTVGREMAVNPPEVRKTAKRARKKVG